MEKTVIIKILIRLFFSITYFLLLQFFSDNVAFSQQESACKSCYSLKQQECITSCSSKQKDNLRRSCNKSCLIEACKSPCGYSKEGSSSSMVSCDYCFQTKTSLCSSECSNKTSGSCYNKCLSRECGIGCRSPVNPSTTFDDSKKNVQSCSSCKQSKELECVQRCPTGDGSIICQFTCKRTACETECE